MSEKLKPCPFCGGKARLEAIDFDDDYPTNLSEVIWWVMCTKCGAHTDEYSTPTEAEAIAAWNTRAERTCKMEVFCMHDEGDFTFRCSECGKGYVEYEPPNYCPFCGARVMSEEEQGHMVADAIRRLEKAVGR